MRYRPSSTSSNKNAGIAASAAAVSRVRGGERRISDAIQSVERLADGGILALWRFRKARSAVVIGA